MAKSLAVPGPEILAAALQGLEAQRGKLDEQIAHVRSLLGRRPGRPAKSVSAVHSPLAAAAPLSSGSTNGSKRILSPDARKRIAAAQKKRWAAFRKKQK